MNLDDDLDEYFYMHKIMNSVRRTLETERWSDCTFIVGQKPRQQIFKGHKLILAMFSPVFEAILYSDLAKTNQSDDPIPIPDIQPETFKILLKYMYTGEIYEEKIDSFAVCELWYCANNYMLQSLMKVCISYLESNLSSKGICRVYECAKFFNELELMNECLDVIRAQTSEVLKEFSWEHIELETLIEILEQDYLQIGSELELFIALERWAKAECCKKSLDPTNGKCLRSVIGNALLKIRFLSLTTEEFVNGPGSSPLLTEDESYAILKNIERTNIKPMPKGFCTKLRSRKKPVIVVAIHENFATFVLSIGNETRFMKLKGVEVYPHKLA